MLKIIRCCLAAQLFATSVLFASEDLFAAPLFSHTKFELQEPYKSGEIVAKARLKDVGDPVTLKKIPRDDPAKARAKTNKDEAAKP